MKISRICTGSQRGDLELHENKHTKSESGKRCYSCGQNLGHYVDEYCSNSTINGVQYLREDRTGIEKIWWAISITLSLFCGVWFIIQSYNEWESSPVVISFATKETPIWQLPFPAVTICPESTVTTSVFNYTACLVKDYHNITMTDEEKRKTDYVFYLCFMSLRVNQSTMFMDGGMFDFMEEIHPKFYEDAFDCKYAGEDYNCSDLFKPIITNEGICYTFNLMDRSQILSNKVIHHKNFHKTQVSHDWSIENGFNKSLGLQTYPRRALLAGSGNGLEINMKLHAHDYVYWCNTQQNGFKVHIAHPYSIPRVGEQHFIVPYGKVVKAAISPAITTTSEEVRQYHPKRRNCYLSSERPLKYFQIYTQKHCNLECLVNYTIRECGCVKFDMPREASTHICGPGRYNCLLDAKKTFLLGDLQEKINSTRESEAHEGKENLDCGCLPTCHSMDYSIESTQVDFDWRTQHRYLPYPNIDTNDKRIDLFLLKVFFKDDQFKTSERNELYSYADFVANVGGLLGLFIGFTALSLVEIIYYLTVRIICNIYMFGKGNWSGKTD